MDFDKSGAADFNYAYRTHDVSTEYPQEVIPTQVRIQDRNGGREEDAT
jgi:hypothetical protein